VIIEIEKEFENTIKEIKLKIETAGCRPDVLYGDLYTVIAVEGDASRIDASHIETFPGVVRTWRVSSPYKTIARKVIGAERQKIERPRNAVIIKGIDGFDRYFDDNHYIFMAGPCTVESYDQLARIGDELSQLADKYSIRDRMILRGGAFKPRTRPWDFRGLGVEALNYLDKVRDNTGLPYITEVMAVDMVDEIAGRADILQLGTRNFQNFNLLEAVGKSQKPVLYKRGIAAQLDEWLAAAEYIALQGNKNIILCERGVKSTVHGDYNRSHIDFDVIQAIKERTILPVVIDPSHSSGIASLVPYQFLGATAFQANGTIVEVISDDSERKHIKCDAKQAVRMSVYEKMIKAQLELEKIKMNFSEK